MEVRSKRSSREREISPDRAKVCMQPKVKPIKKVQVVYYLSRNGQLEHPHYMEVVHFTNHHLRLKDVMDRLTVLRGKGMPSLYSWSCKRSYKNGYVWNDLAENDIIYPSDGAEYVLKGSELVEGCSERLQQLQVTNNNRPLIQELNLHAKGKQLAPSQQPKLQLEETHNTKFEFEDFEEDQEQESQEEYEDEEKTSYTSSTTPHSRCSRGVSTDELEEPSKNPTTESTHHDSSPPPPPPPPSNKAHLITNPNNTPIPKRYEDGDPIFTESAPSRNSVLLQLISCGNLAVAKAKNNAAESLKHQQPKVTTVVIKRSESNLHKGVLYKSAVKVAEEDEIRYMSENPRFGNLQAEEKEYFSGSIVESMSENRVAADSAGLKRSNSYNEERSTKGRMEEEAEQEETRERGSRGKCIPRKMVLTSSSSKQTKK
ncbi:protein SOSEKI 2 [Ricinus communis]|uniref:SOSEKI DIX-like domain-containing protein n=1 Tax=Ricinus communis TaxID=3988 RepID=B9T4H1_RICCO|nr:protein SOSEKI 2 [Ricinus communis]EEF29252.1 conserved hypothetical protein [Ricinus communis]|eukprot:XP_002533140.1 protein UPSTREAM OF FLC [Ricinus communis]